MVGVTNFPQKQKDSAEFIVTCVEVEKMEKLCSGFNNPKFLK